MKINRRKMLIQSAAAGSVMTVAPVWTQDERNRSGEKPASELFTQETEEAANRGLAYLAKRQVQSSANRGTFGTTNYSSGVAVCGLGGLAFMCGGHAPNEGKYGKHVERCVEFLMKNTQPSGYIKRSDESVHENMYGHGFATLFLSEAYGMTMKAEIGEKLRSAINMICKSQSPTGGWRYQPDGRDQDLSITVCQIMALRAAREAGIEVSNEVREKCIEYVKRSQNMSNGSFRYTIGGHETFSMTAAGVTSLYSAGIYTGEQIDKALEYLIARIPPKGGTDSYYFYGQYYAVQAMWHAGGEYWNKWYPAIRNELLKKQNSNGSWDSSMAGPEFGTAMACIILQIPLNYLPVFAP